MPFVQRDIVKLNKPMPGGGNLTHPFIIISSERANSHESSERTYTGVMITDTHHKDKFSWELSQDMVDGRINPNSQVRLHILANFREQDISRDSTHYLGKIKQIHFKALLEEIKQNILAIDS